MIVNKEKRTSGIVDFAVSADLRVSEKRIKKSDFTRELKKLWHMSDGDTNCNWNARYSHQRIGTGTGRLEVKRVIGDHPNYSIAEIGQNTEKNPGDLSSLQLQYETIG